MPHGAPSFPEAIRQGVEVYHALQGPAAQGATHTTAVGDEGGFAPELRSPRGGARSDRWRRSASVGPQARHATSRSRSTARPASWSTATATSSARPAARAGRPTDLIALYERWCAALSRSCRSRTASARTTGPAGRSSPRRSARRVQLVGDDLFVTNDKILAQGIADGRRQRDPHQGEPDRHADRDARHHGARRPRRLPQRRLAPLGRDRGRVHRRPGGRDRRRADQDRRTVPLGAHGQVQPPARDRRGAGVTGAVHEPVRYFFDFLRVTVCSRVVALPAASVTSTVIVAVSLRLRVSARPRFES